MKLREVMSRRVHPVRMNAFTDDAACWMSQHHVTAAPVLDDDERLVGVVTANDLKLAWLENQLHPLRAFLAPIWRRRAPTVREVMTSPVTSLTPGADVAQAQTIFRDQKAQCLLIVDGIRVVGMISRDDLLKLLPPELDGPVPLG